MKCENCNEREATVHYTEIEGSEKKEIHLCEECYRQKAAPVQKRAAGVARGSLKKKITKMSKGQRKR